MYTINISDFYILNDIVLVRYVGNRDTYWCNFACHKHIHGIVLCYVTVCIAMWVQQFYAIL